METSMECRSEATVVSVRGRVDESTWSAFGEDLSRAIAATGDAGLAQLVIDLAELEYMSSRGLRVLTVAKRQGDEAGVGISLASPNEVMREILAISRYDKLFTIIDTADAAP